MTEFLVRHDLIRLGATGHIRRLIELGPGLDGPWVPLAVEEARAILAGDADLLESIATKLGAMGLDLYAADTAALAADIRHRRGDVIGATAAGELSKTFASRCEGARSPVLDRGFVNAPALTPREREIIELARTGKSNREISDSLFVSVRTVEGHLGRAYAKLGVSSRNELFDLMS
jgi:DNA-binding CsgD family transcriptional regulator